MNLIEPLYFNTVNETGEILESKRRKAVTQDGKVLEFFKMNPDKEYTALEVASHLSHIMIEGSAKRACTTLKNKGLLTKTENKRKSKYKANNYTYKLSI